MIEIVSVTNTNLKDQHICCAISDTDQCVASKKAWMQNQLKQGLVFKKLDVRGKVFIEYIPAENAWYPVSAPDYLHINCFWVSGSYKGHGHANQLLAECIADAKRQKKKGICAISTKKKRSFLSDPGYLKYKGFLIADTAAPDFELLYLPFTKDAAPPQFKNCAKEGTIKDQDMVLYFTNQCPFAEKYAKAIEAIALERNKKITLRHMTTVKEAQKAPSPFTTYCFFNKGKFVTNEIFSEAKFKKFLDKN